MSKQKIKKKDINDFTHEQFDTYCDLILNLQNVIDCSKDISFDINCTNCVDVYHWHTNIHNIRVKIKLGVIDLEGKFLRHFYAHGNTLLEGSTISNVINILKMFETI